ncbi:hypothetical protein [Tautonia rosea]|uniref:hypothetical protein n=1 Tax=Tautonia rosea TaxID=2728037 RepID=UPI001473C2E2|nr:hypothetical protein [Tautonia rosea]
MVTFPARTRLLFAFAAGIAVGLAAMIAMVWLITRSEAISDDTTVAELADACRSCRPEGSCAKPSEGSDNSWCLLFAGTVISSMDAGGMLCIGRDWSNRDAIAAFLGWAERHPEAHGMPAIEGLFHSHRALHGCRNRPGLAI